jgi:hypothetical protein
MAYLTWREYTRSGPVCLGTLILIGGAVIALLASQGMDLIPGYGLLLGAGLAIFGLILIIVGFVFTRKQRDSVLTPVDTRQEDTPPPPPPPD